MGKVWGVGHLQGRSVVMIAKCANPVCSTAFHYLREGKIFRMEFDPSGSPLKPKLAGSKPVRKIEHFWLCGACSTTLTLVINGDKVQTAPVEAVAFKTAAPDEFAVRAVGGFRFVTGINTSGNVTQLAAINASGSLGIGIATPARSLQNRAPA
jgi:hypothetical protein